MTREERIARDGDPDPVMFYGGPFSNFSPHHVVLPHPFTDEPTCYPTSEHRYQALKARDAVEHDAVLAARTPGESKRRGQQVLMRDGWDDLPGTIATGLSYHVMREVVLAKALQHPDYRDALEATGSHIIYEDSPTDDIWGWRHAESYSGKNLLGRALMEVRELLRSVHRLEEWS